MRKLLFLAMAGFAMIGCTTTSYSVMNVNSQPKDFDTYKKSKDQSDLEPDVQRFWLLCTGLL